MQGSHTPEEGSSVLPEIPENVKQTLLKMGINVEEERKFMKKYKTAKEDVIGLMERLKSCGIDNTPPSKAPKDSQGKPIYKGPMIPQQTQPVKIEEKIRTEHLLRIVRDFTSGGPEFPGSQFQPVSIESIRQILQSAVLETFNYAFDSAVAHLGYASKRELYHEEYERLLGFLPPPLPTANDVKEARRQSRSRSPMNRDLRKGGTLTSIGKEIVQILPQTSKPKLSHKPVPVPGPPAAQPPSKPLDPILEASFEGSSLAQSVVSTKLMTSTQDDLESLDPEHNLLTQSTLATSSIATNMGMRGSLIDRGLGQSSYYPEHNLHFKKPS